MIWMDEWILIGKCLLRLCCFVWRMKNFFLYRVFLFDESREGGKRERKKERKRVREKEWERKSERERGRMRVRGRGRGSKYLDWVILTPQIDILSERRHCPLPLELSTDFPSVELQAPLINLAECSSVIWNDLCGLYSFFFFLSLGSLA